MVSASPAALDDGETDSSLANWQIVESYIEDRAAWTGRRAAIADAEMDLAEKRRRRKELGPAPDDSHAIQAAKAVFRDDGEKAFDAVAFLLRHDEEGQQMAMFALASLVGPDWSVIEDYVRAIKGSKEAQRPQSPTAAPDRTDLPGAVAGIVRATAAANAILDLRHDQEDRRRAAEFLIEHAEPRSGHFVDGFSHPHRGAEVLASQFPDYDDWPIRIHQLKAALGGRKSGPDFEKLNTLIASLATIAGNASARASARYFTALLLLERADDEFGLFPVEKRRAWRRRALEVATGLSAGVTNVKLPAAHSAVGAGEGKTYADLEADLLDMIHATTLGGNASNLEGGRMDGTAERLSAYGDRLLLLDFWATWCGPCIKAFPELRETVRKFPDDLRILAVSVDDQIDTVSAFLAETSVPWENWHVPIGGDFVRKWRVNGYPTYILIDRGGEVLNRYSLTPIGDIESDIEQVIAGHRANVSP